MAVALIGRHNECGTANREEKTMLRSLSLIVLSVLVTIVLTTHLTAPRSLAFSRPTAMQQNELGLLHMGEQNFEKAYAAFRSAIKQEPRIAEYHFNLAYLLGNARVGTPANAGYTASELFEEMQRESRIARALKPNDYEIAESYAANFQLAEKFGETPDGEEAAAAWEYCLALRRKEYLANPISRRGVLEVLPLLQLGRIALRNNDPEQARAYFEEALALNPAGAGAISLLESCRSVEEAADTGSPGDPAPRDS